MNDKYTMDIKVFFKFFFFLIISSNALASNLLSELLEENKKPTLQYTINEDADFWQTTDDSIRLGYEHLNEKLFVVLSITNDTVENQDIVLEISNQRLDSIKVSYNDGFYETGDRKPFHERPLQTLNFGFPIHIKSNETIVINVEIKSNSAYYIPFKIFKKDKFFEQSEVKYVTDAFCFGLLFSMVVYNLGVFFSSRNRLYFYYSAFLISMMFLVTSISGYAYKYFWPENIYMNHLSVMLFASAVVVFLLMFSSLFLKLNKLRNKSYYYSICVICVGLVVYNSTFNYFNVRLLIYPDDDAAYNFFLFSKSYLYIFLCSTLVPSIYAIILRKYIQSAKYYLFGMSMFVFTFIVSVVMKTSTFVSIDLDPNFLFMLSAIFLSFTFSALIGVKQREEFKLKYKMKRENELLQQKNEEIKEMAETKTNFLANMSHEIRTPMNGVIGMSDMLKETDLTKQQKEYVDIIQNSADSLVGIINDILDISKFEAGKMELESIDINIRELLHQCVSMLVASKGQKLRTYTYAKKEVPEIIQGDPTRIRQIITNFMGNAYKFTENGFVKCVVSCEVPGILRFEIIDSGIGIPEEAQKKLFSKYSQAAKDTARKFGGTGLGLDISKKLAGAMGGEVGLLSKLGEGSNFWFTIAYDHEKAKPFNLLDEVVCCENNGDPEVEKLAKETAKKIIFDKHSSKEIRFYSQWVLINRDETIQELKEEIPDYSHIKVLIAEDNKTNQLVIKGVLKKLNVKPDIANNGLEAVEATKNNKYNIIFMDCEMPEMDGWEATQEIRKEDNKIMIFGLSAHVLPEFEQKAIESGMDGFLSKPIKKEKMFEFFKEHFK
jgi:signal transduction histidine kinase